MVEYRIIRCLGEENIAGAIDEMFNDDPGWKVHSLVCSGLEMVRMSPLLQELTPIPKFVVLFERQVAGRLKIEA